MSNLIMLTCSSCGGRLEVTNNTERYVCVHCGNMHVIDPGERAESLANEVEQMRLKMNIRQVQEDLAALRKHQATLKEQVDARQQMRKVGYFLTLVPPMGVIVEGIRDGASLGGTLFLALFLMGLLLLITWRMRSPNSYKEKVRELEQLETHIASGQQMLNSLQQELKQVSNSQEPTTNG